MLHNVALLIAACVRTPEYRGRLPEMIVVRAVLAVLGEGLGEPVPMLRGLFGARVGASGGE